jgi:hypothetical protein
MATSAPHRQRIKHQSFQNINLKTFPPSSRLSNCESLDFSSNPITSLRDLSTLPSLSHLNLSNTLIESFEGIHPQPSLVYIWLSHTPLGRYSTADVMSIIAFGPKVRYFNATPISKERHQIALFLIPSIFPILQQGWVLTGLYPVRCFHVGTRARRRLQITPPPRGISENNSENNRLPERCKALKAPSSRALPLKGNSNRTDNKTAKEQDLETVLTLISDSEKDSFGDCDDLSLTESWNDSDSQDLALTGPGVESSIKVGQPAEVNVEKMEYHDLTFDEAVAALTPRFQPVIEDDDLVMDGGSSESDPFECSETRRVGERKRLSRGNSPLLTGRRCRR